jgi:hypothetical protein
MRTPTTDSVEREFAEALRVAAYVFQHELDGRFRGAILACQAVIRLIKLRGGGAELAGPFVRIAEAFADLEAGGNPSLFAPKNSSTKERARSPERRVIHALAAAALDVLVRLGDEVNIAAARVARHVNHWPGMDRQDVQAITVINWRKALLNSNARRGEAYDRVGQVVDAIMAQSDPRAEVERLLKQGPPGLWVATS